MVHTKQLLSKQSSDKHEWRTFIASRRSSLQSSVKTVHPGLLRRKAWAAGSSFSIAHRDSAIPDWWKPSDRPQQPIKTAELVNSNQWEYKQFRQCPAIEPATTRITTTIKTKAWSKLTTKLNSTRLTLLKVYKVDRVALARYTLATKSKDVQHLGDRVDRISNKVDRIGSLSPVSTTVDSVARCTRLKTATVTANK